jgi:hypothetical protein
MAIPAILGPAAVLILWTLVVLIWLTSTRFRTFAKLGIDLRKATRGARYADIEENMPAPVNWVSHNYTHLMEQPTLFYAVIAVLALAGDTNPVNLAFAWGYTSLRILHSLWQGLVNSVAVRALIFLLASICLVVLAVNAVRLTVF